MINCVTTLSNWLKKLAPQATGSAVNFDDVAAGRANALFFLVRATHIPGNIFG